MRAEQTLSGAQRKTTELAGMATDRVAQEVLFERVLGRIHRYFFHLVCDPDQAEDCVQETLLLLQRSLNEATYQAGCSFNTWVFMKAHRVWVDWCRRRERERGRQDGEARADDEPAPQPIVTPERRLDAQVVLALLTERLGAETTETFLLRYEGQLGSAEVAAALGCDRRTVTRRLERAHGLIDALLLEGGRQ